METEILHRPALAAILALATSDQRWQSRSKLAADAGFVPSILSDALNPERGRGLSEAAVAGLCAIVPGLTREALILPAVAKPGDLRTLDLERRLAGVQQELSELARTVRAYQGG